VGEKVRAWLNCLLSVLLLFTASIVSNIESVQQTLNLTLNAAYQHVFIPVEALIWIRSIVIILLIVAHALRHVQPSRTGIPNSTVHATPNLILNPELIEAPRTFLSHTNISEEPCSVPILPLHESEQSANISQKGSGSDESEQSANNYERVNAFMATHPDAKVRDVAGALSISISTANKWMNRVKGKDVQNEQACM
jgi:hypothetical protein